MIDAVGFLGAFLLSVCALPQCIKTYKSKTAEEISLGFLLLWGGGEIMLLAYSIMALESNLYLIVNYGVNLSCIGYLLYAKIAFT